MIRIDYPKDRQRLKESYLKVFKSYNKLQRMQDEWDELRETHTSLLLFPPRLETILVAEYPELIRYYNLYKRIPNEERKLMKEKLKDIFNYEDRHDLIVKFLVDSRNNIPIHTCHYCDMSYINMYEDNDSDKGWRIQFDLDHVLDKGACPIVALSLFNFVPSCSVCNSRLKGSRQLVGKDGKSKEELSPTSQKYAFDENVDIVMVMKGERDWTLPTEHREDYAVEFDSHDSDYQQVIDIFRLQERYDYHRIEGLRVMELKRKYRSSSISMMANAMKGLPGFAPEEIWEDIFGERFMTEEHRCFSKFRKDMMRLGPILKTGNDVKVELKKRIRQ